MAFFTETVELRGKDDLLIRLFPIFLADTALDCPTHRIIHLFDLLGRKMGFFTESQG